MQKPESVLVPALYATNGTTYRRLASGVYSPVEMTILGNLPSMKNRRELSLNRKSGKFFPRKSDEALKYVEDFVLQVPPEFKALKLGSATQPLRANVSVFYQSDMSDLDTALVYDCLQLAGVIANDRYIVEHHEWKHIDIENPRAEIRIEEI